MVVKFLHKELMKKSKKDKNSITGQYLSNKKDY
jgi:hypothetical protein